MSDLSVGAAVRRDLDTLAKRAPDLAESALAASSLRLAEALDDPNNSATSKSMCARALLDTLDRLLELAPAPEENTPVDELRAKRATRLAGKAKAKA